MAEEKQNIQTADKKGAEKKRPVRKTAERKTTQRKTAERKRAETKAAEEKEAQSGATEKRKTGTRATATEKRKAESEASEREFIPEPTENIVAGAKIFAEKATEVFSTFVEKVKGTAGTAYGKGSEIYEQVSLAAQGYMEKYRKRSEMASLKESREKIAAQLGEMCFMEFAGRYRFRVEFVKSEEFRQLVAQMRELDRKIIEVGERLEEKGT